MSALNRITLQPRVEVDRTVLFERALDLACSQLGVLRHGCFVYTTRWRRFRLREFARIDHGVVTCTDLDQLDLCRELQKTINAVHEALLKTLELR